MVVERRGGGQKREIKKKSIKNSFFYVKILCFDGRNPYALNFLSTVYYNSCLNVIKIIHFSIQRRNLVIAWLLYGFMAFTVE